MEQTKKNSAFLKIKEIIKMREVILPKILKIREAINKRKRNLSPKTKNLLLLIILISLFLAVLMTGGILYLQYQVQKSFVQLQEPQIFIVSPGESVRQIAQSLKRQGLVKNDFYFLLYFKQAQKEAHQKLTIKAGKYLFSGRLTIIQIGEKLIRGLTMPQEVKITIPEGYNIFQIAKLLKEKGLIKDEKQFLSVAQCPEQVVHKIRNGLYIAGATKKEECLEGYLFPDTYQFKKGASLNTIFNKMLRNFNNKALPLLQTAQKENKDPYKVLIIASLLEKEVPTYYDKRIVAGILYKRLKAGMPLQVDASVLYAKTLEKEAKEFLSSSTIKHNPVTLRDTKVDSPYNTYKHKGLPPGPISNPGLQSIKAALNPIQTDYWYYLNTKEGKTIFSKTYQEHLRNKRRYLE